MDTINKFMLKNDQLKYHYRNDTKIPIGVLSMVDDQLLIAECGLPSVQKNAVINSAIENKRLMFSCKKKCVSLYW